MMELLDKSQALTKVGGWEINLIDMTTTWTEDVYHIHEVGLDYPTDVEKGINFYAPEARPVITDIVNKAIEEGTPWDIELPFITAKGNHKWVRTIGYPKRQNGETTALSGIILDVTEEKQLRQELKKSETFLKEAQRVAKMGSWEWFPDTNHVIWSDQIYEILDTCKEESSGKLEDFFSFLHPDDEKMVRKITARALEEKRAIPIEYRIITKLGEIKYIRGEGSQEFDQNGRLIRLMGTLQDITERKLAELTLREINQRFQLVIEGSGSGTWDWMDVNKEEEWWSPKFYELLGYENNEIDACVGNFNAFLHPDDQRKTFEKLEAHFRNKAPFEIEYRLKTKSGKYKWFFGSGQTQWDEDGNPTRMAGSIIDIDIQKKAQQELVHLTQRLQISTKAAKVGIWDWDLESNELIWDDTMYELYGIAKGDFAGAYESWQVGLHPADRHRGIREVEMALKGEKDFDTEFRVIWPDQSVHHIRAMAKVERDPSGNPLRMLGANWDITKEKESTERDKRRVKELEFKNSELEQFAYVTSHDLQEPLRTISSYVDLLERRYVGHLDDKALRFMEHIQIATHRMKALIKDLLDYSRLGTKKILKRMDCNVLVKDILSDMEVNITESKASVKVERLPVIFGFEVELKQLFQNLISNALKFRKQNENPHIKIAAESRGREWVFSIQDKGIGIEKKHTARIFVIFQRLHNRDDYQGTGIGLAICKKVVELHGGKIWTESRLHEGSTFYFTIPKKITHNEKI